MMPSILIADTDLGLCNLIHTALIKESYQVFIANDTDSAIGTLGENSIDIILLDAMISKNNGLNTAKLIHKRFSTPMIMLSTINDQASRVEFFKSGADQFLPKPFDISELLIRIKSLLKRVSYERMRYKHTIPNDEFEQKVSLLPFTMTEGELVNYLMLNKGKAVSKKELQTNVLKREFSVFDRNLDMHISNIRRKLQECGFPKKLIYTVRNGGYCFDKV